MIWHTTSPPKDGKRFLAQRKVSHFNSNPQIYDYEFVGFKIEELDFLDECFQPFSFGSICPDTISEDNILMWTRDYPIETSGIQPFTIQP
jgi:hypothetical protein